MTNIKYYNHLIEKDQHIYQINSLLFDSHIKISDVETNKRIEKCFNTQILCFESDFLIDDYQIDCQNSEELLKTIIGGGLDKIVLTDGDIL